MTICAYCGQDRKATREHVIPSFLYSFQKELEQSVVGWNEVAGRTIKGEAKIKDVCAECNNGNLSLLDAYGKKFLSDSGLLVRNYSKTNLSLKYDYQLLLRWLLKLSFNSARADGIHAPIFDQHIPFILGNTSLPKRGRVGALLYLAAPELLKNHRSPPQTFVNLAEGTGMVNPFHVRISYNAVRNDRCIHRVIVLGPAIFQLLLFENGVLPGHAASEIRALIKAQPGAVELTASRRVLQIGAGKQSWLDLYEPQVLRAHGVFGNGTGANNSFKPRPLRGSA